MGKCLYGIGEEAKKQTRRWACTGFILCLQVVAVTNQGEQSPMPRDRKFPWGTDFRAFPYYPPMFNDRAWTFRINVVTWINDTRGIFLKIYSNKRKLWVDQVHVKRLGDSVIVFEELKVPTYSDEIVIYHMTSVTTIFTVTFMRIDRKSGSPHQITMLKQQPDKPEEHTGHLVSVANQTRYIALLHYDEKFYMVVSPERYNKRYPLEKTTIEGVFVMLYRQGYKYSKPVYYDIQSNYYFQMHLYDADVKREVTSLERLIDDDTYLCMVPWTVRFFYTVVVVNMSSSSRFQLRCNIRSLIICRPKWHTNLGLFRRFQGDIASSGSYVVNSFIAMVKLEHNWYYRIKVEIHMEDKHHNRYNHAYYPTAHFLQDNTDIKFSFSNEKGSQYPAIAFVVSEDLDGILMMNFDLVPIGDMMRHENMMDPYHVVRFNIRSTKAPFHWFSNINMTASYYICLFAMYTRGGPSMIQFPDMMGANREEPWCRLENTIAGDRRDNDCDEKIDEEILDGIDNDRDGMIDEDIKMPASIDGRWGSWGPYECQVKDCQSSGLLTRKRYCDRPPPQFDGDYCWGQDKETKKEKCKGKGKCYHECPLGTYGWGCTHKCPETCLKANCSKLYGDCAGCVAGYLNTYKCEIECNIINHGKMCQEGCPQTCFSNCDYKTGVCVKSGDPQFRWLADSRNLFTLFPMVLCVIIYCAAVWWWRKDRIYRRKRHKKRKAIETTRTSTTKTTRTSGTSRTSKTTKGTSGYSLNEEEEATDSDDENEDSSVNPESKSKLGTTV